MVISLVIALLSVGMLLMTRRKVSSIRTRAIKRVISLTRRSPMVKFTLVKNGIPMMKAPTPIMMVWQPFLSRKQLLQASLSSQSSIKGKYTYLMAKESKHKVKTKGSSSPRYVTSDDDDASNDDAPFPIGMNEKATIKRLWKELVVWDQLLEVQEDLLEQERQTTCELKKLLNLEKEKNENLTQELAQGKETISSLKSSSGAVQDSYDILQKTSKDLEVQFDAL
jgi:hypothetical protein